MRTLVLGTAGHIDHGKTALVRALTGTDTDRLPEEKRRGITIDIGFAQLVLGDVEYAVVDVPGHESLVRNMLAGATGIDVVLLVVAADEGVMPQTREHLAIMQLLEVREAVIALTKADLVDPEWLELVHDDVRRALEPTSFAASPIVPVSSVTGQGLDALTRELADAAARIAPRSGDDLFRLPIDRVFTIRGTGTVVTGTIWSGRVSADAVLHARPGGGSVRVRGLQRHGHRADEAHAGERVALAVAVDRDVLERGITLVDDGAWDGATVLTTQLVVLPDAAPLRLRQRVRLHIGTSEVLARVLPLDRAAIAPGEQAWAQLRLEAPVLARAGDRFVLRAYSPVRTIAGGVLIEYDAPRRKRLASAEAALLPRVLDPEHAIETLVQLRAAAGVSIPQLPVLTGLPPQRVRTLLRTAGDVFAAGDRLYPASLAAAGRERMVEAVGEAHAARPLEPGLPLAELRRAASPLPAPLVERITRELVEEGRLVARGGAYALPHFAPTLSGGHTALAHALLAAYTAAGLEPPRISELPSELQASPDLEAVLRILAEQGRLTTLAAGLYADTGAISRAAVLLSREFPEPSRATTGMLKQALGLPRKHLIPLLEFFDRVGVTRREGEERMVCGSAVVASGEKG